jgi:hypothetical protein
MDYGLAFESNTCYLQTIPSANVLSTVLEAMKRFGIPLVQVGNVIVISCFGLMYLALSMLEEFKVV